MRQLQLTARTFQLFRDLTEMVRPMRILTRRGGAIVPP
nr:MAG TPA: hypothetical protein [Caudoviricetes sp.]